MLPRGRDSHPKLLQLRAGPTVFFRTRVTLDDFAEIANARWLLAQFEERHAFFEAGWGEFEALGVVGEDLVIFRDRLTILLLRVRDFTEIELGI